MDRLQPKICLNYKSLFLRSPWHLEAQIWRVIRAKIILGRSEKEKRLVSYVSSYSCLGDDRFFLCHPVHDNYFDQMLKINMPYTKVYQSSENRQN